jgi:hypothetical protein
MDSLTQPFTYTSRLAIDPTTQLPSIDSFAGLSDFLRSAIADEESRCFSESMTALAAQAEIVAAKLRTDRHRDRAGPLLMDMLTVLRDHRGMVAGLELNWRGLYEYDAYLQALNNFRVLIGQWLLEAEPWGDQLHVTADDFAQVAWRTLGEGMLLIDVYEQFLVREELQEPQVGQVRQWWHKLRR